MKTIYLFLILIIGAIFPNQILAQNSVPITKGTIQYEKRVNKYAIEKEMLQGEVNAQTSFENYQKNTSQFQTTQFKLFFDGDNYLYKPDNVATTGSDLVSQTTAKNMVATNLKTSRFISQKSIFGETFLVKDNLRKIQWKITNETREIAGYECRRANAIILDSVYVVAFYTVDIVPKGGPELFNGLPGMILGVSLPHEHVTWFATNVSYQQPDGIIKEQPTRGKEATLPQLKNNINGSLPRSNQSTKNILIKNISF